MHALVGEVLARDRGVLGRHAQPRALVHGVLVVEVVAHRDAHAALRDAQVQRLVQALAAVLDQHVAAGHAQVGAAVLDVGRHVGRAHEHHAHLGLVGREDQLAGAVRVFQHGDARGRQQRQGLFEDAALGKCQGDHAVSSVNARSTRKRFGLFSGTAAGSPDGPHRHPPRSRVAFSDGDARCLAARTRRGSASSSTARGSARACDRPVPGTRAGGA